MKSVRKAQKLLGFIVKLGGCVTAAVIMLVGVLLAVIGVLTSIVPLTVVGAIICVFAIVCVLISRVAANLVDGPG